MIDLLLDALQERGIRRWTQLAFGLTFGAGLLAYTLLGDGEQEARATVVEDVVVEGTELTGFIDQHYPKVRFEPTAGPPREIVLDQPEAARPEPWPIGEHVTVGYEHVNAREAWLLGEGDP